MGFEDGLKTIVVATDLEGHSEAALEYARKIAGAYGARIVLSYGLDPLDYAAVDTVPSPLLRQLPEQARAVLNKMSEELAREGIHSHSEVRQGTVVRTLLDVAKQYGAGLIVVGTEGNQGAGPVAVGAIAEELVRLAACPVLAVAADWNAGAFRPTPGGPILLAMEQNEAKKAAVEAATSLAKTFRRALLVVHARTAAEASAFLNPCATSLKDFDIRSTGEFEVRCLVKDGRPIDAVSNAIAQHRPSILVLGVKRISESGGTHGTAFSLLASSRVPVLCVPSKTEVTLPQGVVAVPAMTR
jgi:nucleotide-binding universal stress UspA family protein